MRYKKNIGPILLAICRSETVVIILYTKNCLYAASSPPLLPVLSDVITAPYSANISWVVTTIVYDNETYSVQYGVDMTALQSTSQVVMGNTYQFAVNDVFSVNITGLTPFTTYYYIIWANNSLGNTSTATANFTSGELGS